MFEKEAEDYADETCGVIPCAEWNIRKDGFQKGAEFGYNKANEWHYLSRGEYPDNENDILCRISKDEVVVGYYHIKQKRYITIDGQDLYNVIAWKEIVLPELKESE